MKTALVMCARAAGDGAAAAKSLRQCADGFDFVEVAGAGSIGAGYNQALDMTDADILLFSHTDARFLSGPRLFELLVQQAANPSTGFIGVAGATGLGPDAIWWEAPKSGYALRGAVIHETAQGTFPLPLGAFGPAVALDGLLLAIARDKLRALGPWPEDGWHFYDVEMSFRAHQAGLVNEVVLFPMLHGPGELDAGWETAREAFVRRWHGQLPSGLRPGGLPQAPTFRR